MAMIQDGKRSGKTAAIKVISANEEEVVTSHGTAKFRPVKKLKNNTCKHCWLYWSDCDQVPCCKLKGRTDGQIGIYTIQDMPND
jgi:hypothetical protein